MMLSHGGLFHFLPTLWPLHNFHVDRSLSFSLLFQIKAGGVATTPRRNLKHVYAC